MAKKIREKGTYPNTEFAVKFEDGVRYMRCQNSRPDGKYWKGNFCNSWVRVGDSAVSALCYKCVQMLLDPVAPPKKSVAIKSDKPKGWKFMKEFVDKDGTVYFKGVEQPDLKGTLDVTVIPEKAPKKKISREEKARMIEELGVEIKRLKNQLLVETRKGKKAELTRSLTKANRQLKKLI